MVVFTLRTSWVHHMAQSLEQLIKKQITSGKGQSCPFERIEMTRSEAEEMFKFNKYKLEIIRDIFDSDNHGKGGNKGATESVMVYRCGDLIDLFTGPHIPNINRIKTLKITKNGATYWKNDNKRDFLQRLYGSSGSGSSKFWLPHRTRIYQHRICFSTCLGLNSS
eukprot:686717_1